MPEKNKNKSFNIDRYLKNKYQEELKNQAEDEKNQFKKNYIPVSDRYKTQKKDLENKLGNLKQDSSTEKDKEFNKKYHDDKEWDDKKWGYYENIATAAELGNFIPHPAAQAVGKAGSLASAALAARKAKSEYDKGNYLNAGLNAGLGIFSAGLGAKTGISTVKSSKLNQLEKLISPSEFKSNIINGIDIGRVEYNVPAYLNTFSKNNANVVKNRLSLGAVGADAATDFKTNNESSFADGGQLNNQLDSKYNNYLNNNMRQYAQGGDLTRFDAGGTHEQNPNGGVPQGQAPDGSQNVVEQGESKKGNFIYSNRIELNKDLIKQFSLPGYVAGKSVSDASKAIDDKFKDRSDKYAQETKKTLLDRLANAQEYLKQQEQASIDKTNESMQANSQEIPDQMNGQIPEGMEEYVEGVNSNPQEEQAEQMQGQEGQQPMPPSPIAAFGGYQPKMYADGGSFSAMNTLDPNAGVGYSFKPPAMTSNSVLTKPSVLGNGVGTTGTGTPAATSVTPAMPSAGAIVGAASGAFDLAKTAFGKPAQDTTGQAESAKVDKVGMIGGSALKGAAAGAALGPIGAGVGAAVGLAAGIIGAKKAKQAALENTNNFAINTNNKVSDNYAAYGGEIKVNKFYTGGPTDPIPATRQDSINVRDDSLRMLNEYTKRGYKPTNISFPEDNNDKALAIMQARQKNKDITQVVRNGVRKAENYNATDYRQNIDQNTYRQREAANGVLNMDITPALYDKRITPPSYLRLMGKEGGTYNDGVSVPYYGDLKVSPKEKVVEPPVTPKTPVTPIPVRTKPTVVPVNKVVNTPVAQAPPVKRSNPYMETAGNVIRDNTRVGTSFTAVDPKISNQVRLFNSQVKRANGGMMGITRMAQGGGLSAEDRGSDARPYPSVSSSDFAGGNRSYPIPTKADAVDALRLAGLHGRDDVRLKVYTKYPDLKHAMGGSMNMYPGGGKVKTVPNAKIIKPLLPTDDEIPVIPVTPDPVITPTQTQADFERYANTKKILDTQLSDLQRKNNRFTNKAGKYIGENVGDIARLAPVAMNAYQLKNLKKPEGFQYETLANRYKPQYVDEAQMQRIVDQEGNNTMAAIGQMGGSEGATRNAILAMGLNKTKALGDAYANAAAQNRAQDAQAQQFNLGVDTQNMMTRNRAVDEMRADKGAYDTAKSKYLSSIGTDIGDIGKEKNASDAAITMFGYTRKGKYVVDKDGNKVSPEVLAKRQADFATYISEQNKKAKV